MLLLVKVNLYNSPFVLFEVFKEDLIFYDVEVLKMIGLRTNSAIIELDDDTKSERIKSTKKCLKLRANGLFLQPFVKECINSEIYRCCVINRLKQCEMNLNTRVFLKLILEPPDKEILDYAWNMRMLQLVWMKVEIDKAFSWLSTLGGAYSALGDYFENCAEEAGRISITQYKLSKMLGDESLAARSRLYSALAFSQKGKLKISRHIVREVAQFARATKDNRLNRMCQGVWAKLKYLRQLQKGKNNIR
ncbi:uncharacterized protein F58A4.6 [Aricia agestis]|uniref:uncharacterized protein F58A4.6 n=1 Tax=Aricia agestis TaxID=91739 RepID=UPI001C2078E0|nr:uncharacterized protein F58A4.6 [Aricia agestis]